MKVYVVRVGYYSDQYIDLVTADKEIAEAQCKIIGDEAHMEEFELSEDKSIISRAAEIVDIWRIIFCPKGSIQSVEKTIRRANRSQEPSVIQLSSGCIICDIPFDGDRDKLIKIACDLRASYLARKCEVTL